MGKRLFFGMHHGLMVEISKILLIHYLSLEKGKIGMSRNPFTRRLGFGSLGLEERLFLEHLTRFV
jgi:hypothetical protein